jgi:DMSO/TMAO reductase YedYZ molybdopterin-dependent catalytic subunit
MNETEPPSDEFKRLQAGGFADWRLAVDGMVARPGVYSISELKSLPMRSQITEVVCEEGWSYIAEWIGTPLSEVLNAVGVLPQARYVAYFSIEKDWSDSIDMADAEHPQTLLTWGMNDGDLPVGFGGPLRLRVPRQLGYKSVKYITRLTCDSMKIRFRRRAGIRGMRGSKDSESARQQVSRSAGGQNRELARRRVSGAEI